MAPLLIHRPNSFQHFSFVMKNTASRAFLLLSKKLDEKKEARLRSCFMQSVLK